MNTLAGDKNLVYPIPVEPRKRCIFFFHCATNQQEVVPRIAPLTICPISNVYFRSEGHIEESGEMTGNFLCGVSPTKENDHAIHDFSDLDYADHELWDDIIWPALYNRVPAFGEVKLKSSWAGLYECKFDCLLIENADHSSFPQHLIKSRQIIRLIKTQSWTFTRRCRMYLWLMDSVVMVFSRHLRLGKRPQSYLQTANSSH